MAGGGGMLIAPATSAQDWRDVATLFRAYADTLPIDLGYQDFGAELASLPGKYAAPDGLVLLARDSEGTAVGCVGLRPLGDGQCEMKRLYVADSARGTGLGRTLTEAVIAAARGIGYRELRLDTLATMHAALALYAQLGFRPIAPYYAPTPAGTRFLALTL